MNIKTKNGDRFVTLTSNERKSLRSADVVLRDLMLVDDSGDAKQASQLIMSLMGRIDPVTGGFFNAETDDTEPEESK